MTPRIGITHCAHLADYVEAVRRAGGDPRVIDPGAGEPADVMGTIDGLLLTGGADVNPALYGEASDRHTLCVSIQVECAYRCKFCASGLAGDRRYGGFCAVGV